MIDPDEQRGLREEKRQPTPPTPCRRCPHEAAGEDVPGASMLWLLRMDAPNLLIDLGPACTARLLEWLVLPGTTRVVETPPRPS